jgi:predicted DNA-binding transcriptional regulator AlpA
MKSELQNPRRLMRVKDIVKPDGLLPICRSTLYLWIKEQKFPPGIKLGERVIVWDSHVVLAFIASRSAEEVSHG